MNNRYWWIILILNISRLDTTLGSKWIDSVTQTILKLNSYHVTIVTDKIKTTDTCESIREISLKIPTLVIDFKKFIKTDNQVSIVHPAFTRSGETAFYLIFHEIGLRGKINLGNVKSFFYYFSKISPKTIRPKCLIVVFSKNLLLESPFAAILRYAWEMKFLEVSILIITRSDIILYTYNPFLEEYYKETWKSKSSLFPSKLKDMNGYPIKMPIYQAPPYLEITKTNNGSVVKIDGLKYKFTLLLSKFFNFTIINPMELTSDSIISLMEELKQLLNDGTINMLPNPVFTGNFNFRELFESSNDFGYVKVVAFVPIVLETRVILPSALIVELIMGIIIFIVVVVIAHVLHFEKRYWRYVNIIRTLLSQTTTQKPQKLSERLVFISVILLSMAYTNEFFSQLTRMGVITEMKSFDSLEHILKSNMNIYINPVAFDRIFQSDDELTQIIKLKLVDIGDKKCALELLKNRNIICFFPEDDAKFWTKFFHKYDYTSIIKIANFEIPFDWQTYIYERASPYVKRFNGVLQRIVESGIWNNWSYNYDCCESFNSMVNTTNTLDQQNISVMQLTTILLVGYVVSFIVLSFEFLIMYILKSTWIKEIFL